MLFLGFAVILDAIKKPAKIKISGVFPVKFEFSKFFS